MKILITGEKGFIATNLQRIAQQKNIEVVQPQLFVDLSKQRSTKEFCVFSNSEDDWAKTFERHDVDVVVHNAAVVGTDVVGLNPSDAVLSNIQGTYNICRAAKKANKKLLFLGTTVVYDTKKYQNSLIFEDSELCPKTYYGVQKLAAEDIVKSHVDNWMIIRPLFCYGGSGDNNSLISKSLFAALNRQRIDMFLNPNNVKDYMHVDDFCNAVLTAIQTTACWNQDFNVSAELPFLTKDIINIVSSVTNSDVASLIQWHPNTDYLGNHRLSSQKLRAICSWEPKISLSEGIEKSWLDIRQSVDFDPTKYLQQAKKLNVDLTQFFNTK